MKSFDRRILLAGMRSGKRWGGDTECYWLKRRVEIEAFIKDFIENLEVEKPDWAELEVFESPQFGVIDTSREKNLSNLPRAVVCIDTGVTYPSISDASRALGISNIPSVLLGARRVAGGYRWAYTEDAEKRCANRCDRNNTERDECCASR